MADHTPGYVDHLATQLRDRPDLLRLAENELQELRGLKATVARFIHNPAIALDIRQNLAQELHLPTPEK
ncbi:hypothetical protein ACIQVL_48645 [Streptomyces sp. NPDC090499]|uniref:hypothetical protein n=1 Tax=Streptomyces sp. NPDC090499 TaxID=3365965 RepID=UPI0037F2A818